MSPLPPLELEAWRSTRDTLQAYSRLLGGIRRALAQAEPHWWHASLRPGADGLESGWLPLVPSLAVALKLDLEAHQLGLSASDGRGWTLPLDGRPAPLLAAEVLDLLASLGKRPALDIASLDRLDAWGYDRLATAAWWQTARALTGLLTTFSAGLPGRKSPVQLWPHHFDLALTWFSGRQVPGVDPGNEEMAEEQMSFGFSTGDSALPEPYFYMTAYPWPETLTSARLPAPAAWFSETWQGGLLRYSELRQSADPLDRLLTVLRAAQAAGAARMQG